MGFEPTTLREPTESHLGLAFIYEYSSEKLTCCCCFIFNILTLEVGWLHLGYALM